MKTLNLTLKKKWFNMIASGEKKEEYREIKDYWGKKFACSWESVKDTPELACFDCKRFEIISANNGYSKNCPNIKWEHQGIRVGKPNPAWCEPCDVNKTLFILSIGSLIKTKSNANNIHQQRTNAFR